MTQIKIAPKLAHLCFDVALYDGQTPQKILDIVEDFLSINTSFKVVVLDTDHEEG